MPNHNKFIPHPAFRGGHMQTMVARLSASPPNPKLTKKIWLELGDGDQVYFEIDEPQPAHSRPTIVALFHGLGGCARSDYNLRISSKLTQLGYRVARFSHRGCGSEGDIKARNIYHCGSYDDMFQALQFLASSWPTQAIYPVGFSISGAILLNMLGEYPELHNNLPQLKQAIAICPPLDLKRSSNKLNQLNNLIYSRYFTYYLIKQVRRREQKFPDVSKTQFSLPRSLKKFDQEFTAPTAGFQSRDEYYKICSPAPRIAKIKIPTLVIAAADDPVICTSAYQTLSPSAHVKIAMQNFGGHMGFVSKAKTSFGDHRWMDEAIIKSIQTNG